jgi:NADPH-dependent 2,4-dienoyl-CoA reductase/sulfur reductase-like enzyme
MKTRKCDVVIVGSGPAGLAAAIAAKENNAGSVLIIERDAYPGGILQQCIHPGFGLKYFNEELTGPEYAQRFIDKASALKVETLFNTMAIHINQDVLTCVNTDGVLKIEAGAIILAMGCRERTRANLVIPGSRPAGIYTAGTAQRLMNIQGHKVGKEIVILGSGDIGMIMARRMTLEGVKVKAVVEIMPYLAGLTRNKVQCLDDFGIPLLLSHTIVDITGIDRVESVTIAPVDSNRNPILEKSQIITCDTLLLSVGLIPENELSKTGEVPIIPATKGASVNQYMQTLRPNIFSCGNVLHVNDLVDNVSREGEIAGMAAALYSRGELPEGEEVPTVAGENINYVCPQRIVKTSNKDIELFFRVKVPGHDVILVAQSGDNMLARRKTIAVSPGEIESLTIKKELLKDIGSQITINAIKTEVR